MVHIDEHKLEMYVLGATEVLSERVPIEDHLRDCPGCRALAEAIAGYYREADRVFSEHTPPAEGRPEFHPTVVHTSIREGGHRAVDRSPIPNTRLDRLVRFARRRPVAAGAASLGITGVMALGVSLLLHSPFRDWNPAYVHLNPGANTFEVYNKDNALIRSLPTREASVWLENDKRQGSRSSIVADLNHDGRNEIVTTVTFDWEENSAPGSLRVFSSELKLLHEVRIGHPVNFLSAGYNGIFPVNLFLEGAYGTDGGEALLAVGANGRSPWVMSRFDNECRLMGEFWHFGNLPAVIACTLPGDQRKLVLLAGINDVNDTQGESFPVILVVDPAKISGVTESVGTRGFGMPPSQAEVMYIRIPHDDVSRALNHKGLITHVYLQPYPGGDRLTCSYQSADKPPFAEYSFVFSTDMRITDIKPSDFTREAFRELVRAGRLRGSLDQAFLSRLAQGIRYWDGQGWSAACVRVARQDVTNLPTGP